MIATAPRFHLYYWPIPFRGCFVSYLFAYRDVPLRQTAGFDEIRAMQNTALSEQPVPFVGPPILQDLQTGQTLSQMPAIVLYASHELDLLPSDSYEQALAMKVLMDCNDVLMEICRYNGSMMWEREAWLRFRGERLPYWLELFDESLRRGHVGTANVSFADIGVHALFGNMMRCLPALEPDVREHAPGIHRHCARIGGSPTLAAYIASEAERFGDLYCGGQIEQSIRSMLALDAAQAG
ncbi:MAG: glutathione S-transferase family protein [Pseudomonadota bacterium]